ncbi:YraN family protein [Candidatus Uhrbacteria bacterium]|nr:YraN family protein [Candidatus Uhrbacteria bacterium]
MTDFRREFGTFVEKAVAKYLENNGFRILRHQYKSPFGEIDLVCQDGDEVVFVEVKARHTSTFGYPEESVTPHKLRHIVRCGQSYLQSRNINTSWRIDVIAVEFSESICITHLKAIDIPDGVW